MNQRFESPFTKSTVFGDQNSDGTVAREAYIDALDTPEEIKAAQERLSKAGFYTAEGHRFHNDGIKGDVTVHALRLEDSVYGDDYARKYLKDNLSDKERTPQEVMKLQAALNRLGLDAGSVDGKMGNNTLEALDKFLESEKTAQALSAELAAPTWRAPMKAPIDYSLDSKQDVPFSYINPTAKWAFWKTDFANAAAWSGSTDKPLGPVGITQYNKTDYAADERAPAAATPAALKIEPAAAGNSWLPRVTTEIFNFMALPLKPFIAPAHTASADDLAFDAAYKATKGFEGGRANNPLDRGGPTVNGISSKWWPDDYKAVIALENAGKDQEAAAYTRAFYKTNFWDELPAMAGNLAGKKAAFDASVNHGMEPALGMLENSGGDVRLIKAARQDIYQNLIETDPSQIEFAGGWSARIGVPKSSLLASSDVGAKSDIVFSKPAVILNEGEDGVNNRIALSTKTFPAAVEATEAATTPIVVAAMQEPQKVIPTSGSAGGLGLAY